MKAHQEHHQQIPPNQQNQPCVSSYHPQRPHSHQDDQDQPFSFYNGSQGGDREGSGMGQLQNVTAHLHDQNRQEQSENSIRTFNVKSIFNAVHVSQQSGNGDGVASRHSIDGGFGQASSNVMHLYPADQSIKQPTDSEGGLSSLQPTPVRVVTSQFNQNSQSQQSKGLNQGQTPSHDIVNSQSATQAMELSTPMNNGPSKQFAVTKEEAFQDLSEPHVNTKVSSPGLNLSSGKKSSSSEAKKKPVRTRAQTRKPAKSKPKKD